MGIAFEHDAVLECAGFAFICVADDVFLVAMRHADKFPLATGGEACAAVSLQARFLDGLDHLFRASFRSVLCRGLDIHFRQ